ncbi:MAG: hypothetical protein QMC95_13450 [Desulfitobacteriaceae bacterium]|nr:hypothetical protein [Desulfitobacteriaceae bacterium]MDI6915205.1 hypothetical protein [Desulfitobacteriaceae bacterium]
MTKKVQFLFSIIGLTLLMANPVFATEANLSQFVVNKQVITDKNVLFNRAVLGITDLADKEISPKAELVNKKAGKKRNLKTYTTTQLVKEVKYSDGKSIKTYATTSFTVIKPKDLSTSKFSIQSDGSKSDSLWDQTLGVQAYSTIYWNYTKYAGDSLTYVGLVEVSGGWTIYDSTEGVNNTSVLYGQAGIGHYGYVQVSMTHYPLYLDYDYFSPSSWDPVYNYSSSTIGSTSHAKVFELTNPSSMWDLVFTNNIY